MKRLLLLSAILTCALITHAQLLTWTPAFPKEADASQTLVITVDATKGNQGLLNHTPTNDVYVHIGVITNKSNGNWVNVPFQWGTTPAAAQATYIGNSKWQYTINGSLRSFFNVQSADTVIQKVAILFRSGNGNKKQTNSDGSDMFIPVYDNNLAVRIDQPFREPRYVPVVEPQNWIVGSNFTLTANANKSSAMKLYHNGTQIASASGVQTISANSSVTAAGSQQLVAESNDGSVTKFDTINIFVAPPSSPVAALPAGAKDGINYNSNTSVTLVLHAPGKNLVTVIGDFNNWIENTSYVMNKTPDGNKFWLTINGLTAGTEYAFQYVVDNSIKIGDPYAEKILDPSNDGAIGAATYPNLKPYPFGKTTGIVSVFQISAPAYNWSTSSFTKPDKRNLIIYELLLRDFIGAHNWQTLKDTLGYLKRMGVNAIELMPFNEFEHNISWGYNPTYYFAPDKYYGPKNRLKEFIDSCHKNGIAVIMDIVLNHTYGPSPLAMLYWDAANNRPAPNNPWYNPVQPHAFGFGEDFNHESAQTKAFFNRVLQHWVTEYKIDGYRFDFSKGLTQRPSNNDGAFSAYDASRISIINGYYNAIKTVDPNAYVILEHFADNTEEKELADNGMLVWSSVWNQYQEAAMGYLPNSNFERGIHTVKGWNNPHLVTYMESHDEERIVYKNLQFGNANASYNTKILDTALRRMEMNAAFLFSIPGPKMIWQFGELGYDYSINACPNGTVDPGCRTAPKPIRWDYNQNAKRKQVYDIYSQLIRLRSHPWYKDAFMSNRVTHSLGGGFKWIQITTDTSNLVVVGNFDINTQSGFVIFPSAGTWYDYLQNKTLTVTGGAQSITLAPGEYHVYVNRNVNNLATPPPPPPTGPVIPTTFEVKAFPNPSDHITTVEVKLPESSAVTIEVINSLGQQIHTIQTGSLAVGTHRIPVNRARMKMVGGIYKLRVKTKTATQTISVFFK